MAKIKIMDLPKDMKISREEMKQITGGTVIDDMIKKWNQCVEDASWDDAEDLDLPTLLK